MASILYPNSSYGLFVFLGLTVILGGMMCKTSGEALAKQWRPMWQILPVGFFLALILQFLHYALFYENILVLQFLMVKFCVAIIFIGYGYVRMRREQMIKQYSFRFIKKGYFLWEKKA